MAHSGPRALVESLKTASTAEVPDIVKELSGYRRWARRPVSDLLSSTEEQSSPHHSTPALPSCQWTQARSNTSTTGC